MTASDDRELEDAGDVLEVEYEESEDAAARPQGKSPGRFRRFVRSVFSHLVFAGLVLGATSFFGYLNNKKIMRDVGDRVCAESMLGAYLSKAGKTTVAATSPASPMTSAAAAPTTTTAATKSAAKTSEKTSQKIAMPSGKTPSASTAPAAAKMPAPSRHDPAAKSEKSIATGASPSAAAGTAAQQKKKAASPPQPRQRNSVAGKPPGSAAPAATTTRQLAAVRPSATLRPPPVHAPAATRARQGAAPPPSMNATQSQLSPNRPVPNPTAYASRPMPAQQNAGPSATVTAPSTKRVSLMGALQQARQAQASGKAGADEIYKQLIRQYPNSPDLPGELGNIYYWQGKLAEAAEQYYETAQRLIRRNQSARAACLLPVLKRIDPARAAALSSQTREACPSARRQ